MVAGVDDHVGHVDTLRIRWTLGARSSPGVVIVATHLGEGQQVAGRVVDHRVLVARKWSKWIFYRIYY